MNAESILRSRTVGSVALGLAAVLTAIGLQQGALRTIDADLTVLAPLAVAMICTAAVLLAGSTIAGGHRTPYW